MMRAPTANFSGLQLLWTVGEESYYCSNWRSSWPGPQFGVPIEDHEERQRFVEELE